MILIDNDELFAHRITFKKAVERFYKEFEIRRNKSFTDRYQLIGETFGGRKLKIIFQLKPNRIVRIITGWDILNKNLTEKEIDELVISQANDDEAWKKPIRVNRKKVFSLNFPQPSEIVSEKDVLNGTPVFRGTRVPVSALLDNLEAGVSLDKFLENFPTVR